MQIRLSVVLALAAAARLGGQSMTPRTYDMGSPVVTDIWVDPAHGDDGNTGHSRAQALRTLNAAWALVPQQVTLTGTGYRLMLTAGTYTEDTTPIYWASRWGTFQFPVILQAADGQGTALLPALNIFDCRYLYLIGIQASTGGGDVLHLEQCRYVLVRQVQLVGTGDLATYNAPDESMKANQSSYVYVEDSDISGAQGPALDFVAVQWGHLVGNRIHHAGDWCAYLKGGSSYFRIESNELYDCGTGGFTAGQGSGFEYMVSPWIHYEAENLKFINNVVHDTDGAGIGVNGGYNILMAHNTMYRVGQRDHGIEVVFGLRGCNGNTAVCNGYLAAGGWGGLPGADQQPVPNRNVYLYNNVLYNPAGYQSQWTQFVIPGPQTPVAGTNLPSPANTDTNLRIRVNVIWNGPVGFPLGIEEPDQGCQASNPTCNAAQLARDNAINSIEPRLTDPAHGNFTIASGVSLPAALAIPDFPGGDAPQPPVAPVGNLANADDRDYAGQLRPAGGLPGAFAAASPASSPASRFVALAPCRVVDTRNPAGDLGGPRIEGGATRTFDLASGACGIPTSATAYSLNATVVPAGSLGYLTLWPAGQAQPVVSTLNSLDGRIKANAAIVPAGAGGAISVFVTDPSDVILDVNGYFVPASGSAGLAFYPLPPCRVADTRAATGIFGGPRIAGGSSRGFPIAQSTCGVPAAAQAYSLNFTAVPRGALGYLTTWPAGETQPLVSTLNAPTGTVTANAAIVPAGSGGAISVYVSDAADLVIDVNGYFAPLATGGLSLYTLAPCRVVDTRLAPGALGGPMLAGGQPRALPVPSSGCGVPTAAQAYSLNATVVPQGALGYLTLWPAAGAQPLVSTLNSLDGTIVANAALVPAGSGGSGVSAYVSDAAHLVLDVNGYFAP